MTLADYSLTPDVAIVDPQFVMSMPKGLTADTGIDCLTHALEAGVSIYASPYTDANAMQAIRLVFKYLPIAYEHPDDEEARSMMHNAACIAAMAFSNASVGVNHALAHAFGARFRVAHGRANALMLPHVIAYNAVGAHQVHAVAEPARLCRAQEIRHAWPICWAWAATPSRRRCSSWSPPSSNCSTS